MASPLYLFILSFCLVVYTAYKRYSRPSLKHIPGPEPESFWLGSLRTIFQSQAGEADLEWAAKYGQIVRFKAAVGEDRLMISDPKAIHHIVQAGGYMFPKPADRMELSRLTTGQGLVWAEGQLHKRQRYVMNPGFGIPEARSFLPVFSGCAAKIATQWSDLISNSSQDSAVISVCGYLQRATLDAIGEAAFDYNFGAIDKSDNPLFKVWSNLFLDFFGVPTSKELFLQSVFGFLPIRVLSYLLDHSRNPKFVRAREAGKLTDDVARDLVTEKKQAALMGIGNRDILSILVQSNAGQNARGKLDDWELIAQMRTIMVAGHETTANTLNWGLLELAKNPDVQSKLRAEIWAMEDAINSRGSGWNAQDYDSMPYLTAVVKEILRMYPVAFHLNRITIEDTVLPLSAPITSTNSGALNEIVVPKGTKLVLSIHGYNKNKSVWGPDAEVFNPDRWLQTSSKKTEYPIGVYGNLLTFAGGVRSCIGWRMAVIELHAFIVELAGKFKFEMTPQAHKVRRVAATVTIPTVEGEYERGHQLPLLVSPAYREN